MGCPENTTINNFWLVIQQTQRDETKTHMGGWGTSGASHGQLGAIHVSNTTQNRSQTAKCYINF